MKKSFIIAFFITGVFIGFILALQLNSSPLVESDFLADEVVARDELINDLLNEQGYLQSRIVRLRGEIEASQGLIETNSEQANLDVLNSLKQSLGLTKVFGRGVKILLDDSPLAARDGINVSDDDLIQASDIRDIVNLLFSSHFSSISVNNQRVLASSTISSVGSTILIDNAHVVPPFVIISVGDSALILQKLLNVSLLPNINDRKRKSKIVFEFEMDDSLSTPVYNGDLKTNTINLVE